MWHRLRSIRRADSVYSHRAADAANPLGRCVAESDEDLRAIEFDENREREGLSTYDDSKQRLAEIRQAEADLRARAERKAQAEADSRSTVERESKPERKPKPGSRRAIADEAVSHGPNSIVCRTGTSRSKSGPLLRA